jgi:hypothetical protein
MKPNIKSSILFSAILVVILSIGSSSSASAQCYGRHYGWRPRARVCAPVRVYVPPVVVGGYYGGNYGGYRHYCPPPAPRYYGYARPHYHRCYR